MSFIFKLSPHSLISVRSFFPQISRNQRQIEDSRVLKMSLDTRARASAKESAQREAAAGPYAASATDRERAGEGEGEERSRLARNSCNLMGFFDWYLMPVAIGPIHTPLTYPKGIYKNRGFCAARGRASRGFGRRRRARLGLSDFSRCLGNRFPTHASR